jgi:hypothetical protein
LLIDLIASPPILGCGFSKNEGGQMPNLNANSQRFWLPAAA